MTEAEWLASNNPAAMMQFIAPSQLGSPPRPMQFKDGHTFQVSNRKLWLFVKACYLGNGVKNYEVERGLRDGWPNLIADIAMGWAHCGPEKAGQRAALLRDIIGNPWRPVAVCVCCWQNVDSVGAFCHGCRRHICIRCCDAQEHFAGGRHHVPESTVRVLATAFEERAGRVCDNCEGSGELFRHEGCATDCGKCHGTGRLDDGTLNSDRLAIIGDALEEACCTDAAILSHLRSPGPHVRGCWAIDLLLGLE